MTLPALPFPSSRYSGRLGTDDQIQCEAHVRGWVETGRPTYASDRYEARLSGIGASCWVARTLGLAWHDDIGRIDVGEDVEVKNVRRRDGYLQVDAGTRRQLRWVLTYGTFPGYEMIGWIAAADLRPEWLTHSGEMFRYAVGASPMINRREVYVVPHSALYDPAELDEILRRERGS